MLFIISAPKGPIRLDVIEAGNFDQVKFTIFLVYGSDSIKKIKALTKLYQIIRFVVKTTGLVFTYLSY
jgi:hypothetical protein